MLDITNIQNPGEVGRVSLPAHTEGVPDLEIILTGVVAEVVVRGARVADLALVRGFARLVGLTVAVYAFSVRAPPAAFRLRVADAIISAVLVLTATLVTTLVLKGRAEKLLMLETDQSDFRRLVSCLRKL